VEHFLALRVGGGVNTAFPEIALQVRRWGQGLPRTTQLLWCLVVAIIVVWAGFVLIGATTTS
jgi:hypothetical protein